MPPYPEGGQTTVRVQVIDGEKPANSDFLLASQCSVTGALSNCRPDRVSLVNGLAPSVIGKHQAELRMQPRRAGRVDHFICTEMVLLVE